MKKIVVAYIPALHQGYVNFFQKYVKDSLYLVGDELLKDLALAQPYYGRDIRALSASLVLSAIKTWNLGGSVYLLDKQKISELQKQEIAVVMPDEDISHDLAAKFFPQTPIEYLSVFLRWDKRISEKEYEVSPDRVISRSKFDQELMKRALDLSQRSPDWWRQIGAIAVRDGQIVLEAFNQNLPNPDNPNVLGDPRSNFDAGVRIDLVTTIHAEASIVAEAAKLGISLAGAVIYVTTFPCPPCARLLIGAGVKKICYARGYSLFDSEELLKQAGVEVVLVKD